MSTRASVADGIVTLTIELGVPTSDIRRAMQEANRGRSPGDRVRWEDVESLLGDQGQGLLSLALEKAVAPDAVAVIVDAADAWRQMRVSG